jgi:hypothetical protein
MLKNYYTTEEQSVLLSLYKNYSEKLQRHFLATECLRLGTRSAAYLCRVYKCSPKRIYAGLAELAEIRAGEVQVDYGRQRRAGGGAKKKK